MKSTTLKVKLTPELKAWVEASVKSGLYENASDVIRAALREMQPGQGGQEPPELEALIEEAFASGPGRPLTSAVWRSIRAEARRLRRKKKRAA